MPRNPTQRWKGWTPDTLNSMNEPENGYSDWKKLDKKEYIPYGPFFIKWEDAVTESR